MKQFDLDWAALLRSLDAWSALDVRARRRLLDTLKPSVAVAPRLLGDQLDALQAAGLVETTGARAAVVESRRPFVRALRAMDRHRTLLREATLPALTRYLEEHFTAEELQALQSGSRYSFGWVNRSEVARHVASVDWVEAFLALGEKREAREWEKAHRRHDDRPLLATTEVFEAAQRLLQALAPHREGLPLGELSAALGGMPALRLGGALHALLRYLLAYAVLDPEALEPRVGVWPPAGERLGQPPLPPPQPLEAAETFHAALLMEDMTAVLVAAAGEPLRLRGTDFRIFARQQQSIAERLLALPCWAAEAAGFDTEERISDAAGLLRTLELARAAGVAGETLRLEPTRKGTQWLALSDCDRLAALLDPLRASRERNPTSWYSYSGSDFGFFPQRLNIELPRGEHDLRAALSTAFLELPAGEFVPLDTFLTYQSQQRNPLLTRKQGRLVAHRTLGYGSLRMSGREEWEQLWGDLLRSFLRQRLLAFGGARLGRTAEGVIGFSLTDAGRYLLGAADGFEYGHDTEAEVIVQPNFEIVFLAPAPRIEAQLARFAERAGAGPGVMFRLTRASILAAAEAGLTLEQVLGALRQASARELPGNLERQIRDWFGIVRRIALRHTVLIRCPDAETAAKVRAAGGDHVRPLTDTVLEMANSTSHAKKALLRRLRKDGVFVER